MPTKKRGTGGFSPANPAADNNLSISDLERILGIFQRLTNNPLIKWSIYAAGIAALLDIVHLAWLAARYVFRF
jgi:hypothetical protein